MKIQTAYLNPSCNFRNERGRIINSRAPLATRWKATLHPLLLVATGVLLASVNAQTVDRSQADAPGSTFAPAGTQNIDTTLPGAAVPSLQHRPFTKPELNKSKNPTRSASEINPSERRQNQLGRSWRGNPRPEIEVYVTPLSPTIPNSGGNARGSIAGIWDQQASLAASVPRQNYLRQAGPALNSPATVIPLTGGVGDAKFFRASFEGELKAQLVAGTAKVDGSVNLQVTAFRKLRNFARIEWRAAAAPGQSGPFSGTVAATILGRKVKTWTFADNKPIKQSFGSVDLTTNKVDFFETGSYDIPWLGYKLAFGAYLDKVKLGPKVGVGPASALVELAVDTKTRAYAELPIYSLFYGLMNLTLRLDSDLLSGEVRAGDALSVILQDGRGYAKNSMYLASTATAGGGILKLKLGTHLFGISFLDRDYTLAKILEWKGFRIDQTLVNREQTTRL